MFYINLNLCFFHKIFKLLGAPSCSKNWPELAFQEIKQRFVCYSTYLSTLYQCFLNFPIGALIKCLHQTKLHNFPHSFESNEKQNIKRSKKFGSSKIGCRRVQISRNLLDCFFQKLLQRDKFLKKYFLSISEKKNFRIKF